MRSVVVTAAIASASFAWDSINLGFPLPVPVQSDEWLYYDDATAVWLNWQGEYRGVWFDLEDFGIMGTWESDCSEFWFYHDDGLPWDTSSFYAELYDGDGTGPTDLLDQTTATAMHYTPIQVSSPGPVACGNDFWVVLHTDMSAGGWPSLLSDGTPAYEFHSYTSDDGQIWTSWGEGDFIIRAFGEMAGLEADTWGSIKTLFD